MFDILGVSKSISYNIYILAIRYFFNRQEKLFLIKQTRKFSLSQSEERRITKIDNKKKVFKIRMVRTLKLFIGREQ